MGRVILDHGASMMLANITVGRIRGVAYDTAWAARPLNNSRPVFPGALRWLLRNQMSNGAWGSEIDYKHDRVLSTTAAIIALEQNDNRGFSKKIDGGLGYLWSNIDALDNDPCETIGSELLLPSLLEEGQDLGIDMPKAPLGILRRRERKLSIIPDEMIYSRETTLAYSLEFLGKEVSSEHLDGCISPNGSLGCSPSATMFLLDRTRNGKAKNYLTWVSNNMFSDGFPSQLPFETFECAWSLYNFIKAGWTDIPGMKEAAAGLYKIWHLKENGVSWGKEFPICDSDTSAITLRVLREFGYSPDTGIFDSYEKEEGFLCSEYELNPSVSAHVHILEAIKDIPKDEMSRKDEKIDKLISFLRKNIVDGSWWKDKWHASPYYTTGHAVLALASIDPSMVEGPVDWILRSQNLDGGWGFFGRSTVEETSYALQALLEYGSIAGSFDTRPLSEAANFIASNMGNGFERLWIAKGLYCPVNVVFSAAISALKWCDSIIALDPTSLNMFGSPRGISVDTVKEGGI